MNPFEKIKVDNYIRFPWPSNFECVHDYVVTTPRDHIGALLKNKDNGIYCVMDSFGAIHSCPQNWAAKIIKNKQK